MKKVVFGNSLAAILCLSVLLAADFITMKMEAEPVLGYIYKGVLLLFFSTSLVLNKDLFGENRAVYLRYSFMILFCILITAAFAFFALVVVVNFHLAIGGSL